MTKIICCDECTHWDNQIDRRNTMLGSKVDSYDDELLKINQMYSSVGINDGTIFKRLRFIGFRSMNGKSICVFMSTDNKVITVNPSYLAYTMREDNHDTNN